MNKIFSHFKNGSIIDMNDFHVTYKQRMKKGRGTATVYPVMTGIEVIFLDFKGKQYLPVVHKGGNILEINHCLTGRTECRMSDGLYQYASAGDLLLNSILNHGDSVELPTGTYKGLVITIDIDEADNAVSQHFYSFQFTLSNITGKFLEKRDSFIIPAKDEVQRILQDMYTVPEAARPDYFRLKVLELLIYLHYFDPETAPHYKSYTRQQVDIIKRIQHKLTSELNTRFTINALAREFNLSPTSLKSGFKAVYGKAIAEYMQEYRMHKASQMLRKTDLSIADISVAVGYASQSNFGALFRETYGKTPLEYRKKYEY